MIPRTLRTLAAMAALAVAPMTAQAANCTATVTDVNFGTVTLRAGANNTTQGNIRVTCSNPLLLVADVVGVCVQIGPGSGGAGAGNSPRYMRNGSGRALAYDLRLGGSSAVTGPTTEVFRSITMLVGLGGTVDIPIYGRIVENAPSVPTGSYASNFSGPTQVKLTYGVLACGLLGQTSTPAPFTVSAQLEASCEIDVSSMNFGVIPTQLTAPVDQTASLNVRCSDATPYTVTLGQGTGGGTDPARRRMKNGANVLEYGLYRDAARSAVWGATPTTDLDATGAGLNQGYTIYGRIHAGQSAEFGTYTDSVVVTVNY
ncbi:Csu type fimbrial protein [Vannielia litorea]|nr:spore coat U domain-containing protein [Vannielia litorea]